MKMLVCMLISFVLMLVCVDVGASVLMLIVLLLVG